MAKNNKADSRNSEEPTAGGAEDSVEVKVDSLSSVSRKQLRNALGENSDLRARDMIRAIRQAETPEEALAAMATQAAEAGERVALTKNVAPTVPRARIRLRHVLSLLSFLIAVPLPTGATYWYLTERAVPQYASLGAFSIRKEEHGSPTDLLGSAFGLASTSTNDTDVLYDFLTSQEIVTSIKEYRDLEAIWSGPGTDWETGDPVFAMPLNQTIEDQTKYWNRMVDIAYDTSASILQVTVLAFDPDDAQMLTQDILNESTQMINALSSIARTDALNYASEDLEAAEKDLKAAREALTTFRNENQIASIDTDIALSTGPLNALTQQLVEAKIERGLLGRDITDRDPRLVQINSRVKVIEAQIQEERAKLGAFANTDGASVLSQRIAEFERLNVELKFGERTYEAALSAFYAARSDANRQSLYLAAHKNPTKPERSDYPDKFKILGIVGGFSFAIWGILALFIIGLRDRR